MLDGNSRLNMATFVTTWIEPQAEKLMAECFDKTMIDKDEYPQTAAIEERRVNSVSNLFNASEEVLQLTDENTIGVVAILGTTFTGEFEPIEEIHDALVKQNAETGWEVLMHIDAASGYSVFDISDKLRQFGWQTSLHHAGTRRGCRGVAHCGQGRLQCRHGGHAARGYSNGGRSLRSTVRSRSEAAGKAVRALPRAALAQRR